MKTNLIPVLALASAMAPCANGADYVNTLAQVQVNSGVDWRIPVHPSGSQLSELEINPGGARFELWTYPSGDPSKELLLNQTYVGAYVPQATIEIRSEDPYVTVKRTRADRPFAVSITTDGMISDITAPDAARMVKFQRLVQSYGPGGTGVDLDRTQATVFTSGYFTENKEYKYEPEALMSVIPGSPLKLRGEETFSVYSLADNQDPLNPVPEMQIASRMIQIWPVAEATISGIANDDQLRFSTPTISIALKDLYPDSTTYAQVYKGPKQDGVEGQVIPGSAIVVNDSVPKDSLLVLDHWDEVIDDSGEWTIEVLTDTPFDISRLAHVTFTIDRTIRMNGTVTTVE